MMDKTGNYKKIRINNVIIKNKLTLSFLAVTCLLSASLMCGCGKSDSATGNVNQSTGVEDVPESGMAAEDGGSDDNNYENIDELAGLTEDTPAPDQSAEDRSEAEDTASGLENIDVDLTTLSSTMVYSEVYNMLMEPENYIGKTVKMDGAFTYMQDEATGKYYFACIIQDATACCSQGLEFVTADELKFPEDYPEAGDDITVVGVFDTYNEGDNTYCTLKDAKITS